MTAEQVGRNDPCPCGSGKKYKNCCLGSETSKFDRRSSIAIGIAAVALVVAAILFFTVGRDAAFVAGVLGFLIAGGWLLFADPPSSRGPGDPGAISFGG